MTIVIMVMVLFAGTVLLVFTRNRMRAAKKKEVDLLRHEFEVLVTQYVNVLHDKIKIIDQYVPDYFNSITESEYPQLKSIDTDLQTLTNECYEYLLNENTSPVYQLMGYLEGGSMVVTLKTQALTTANLHTLNEWRRKAHEHLVSTVLALKRTSTQNQAAELQRNRNRLQTEDMLNDIIRWSFPNQHT